MSPLLLPITLATAGALGLVGLILALRVTMGRSKHNVIMGDGGNADMIVRMRTHANFVEYVPLMLVLLGLLELGGANRTALMVGAAVLVVARISHAIGMGGPMALRVGGAMATYILLAAGSIYALKVTLPHLSG
jgi:uncharacterized membrane protein YecN with MAPEG domain